MNQYIVGHRGAAGLAPENTLKAFKIGCENNADVVECDIHLSKDKKLIVIHDGILDRTTNGKGWVKDYTFEELRKLDAGDGEKIPTLEEVINIVFKFNKKLIIEIKAEDWQTAEELTNAFIVFLSEHKNIISNIFIHSFWHEVVKNIKQKFPEVQTFIIMMLGLSPEKMLQLILDSKANGAAIENDYISSELVSLAHKNNLSLNAWLLNDQNSFDKMKKLGVDGLITNYPGRFKI